LRLAGPGAGNDEERAFAMAYGAALLRIETVEQGLDAARRSLGRGFRGGAASPHGYLL
jgi:hypothetical protein